MDGMRFGEEDRGRNGDNLSNVTFICKESRDHVHYPQSQRARSPRRHHAPSPIFASGSELNFGAAAAPSVRYRECRKNQAAGVGGTAYDGCGEFVAAGDDPMKCAACGCHRSFHRRDPAAGLIDHHNNGVGSAAAAAVLNALQLSSLHFREICSSPSGCRGEGGKESPAEDRKAQEQSGGGKGGGEAATGTGKRFKTKFTAEQKERMRKYAEKLQWKMSNERGKEVDKFCAEIGVERKIFRVWMNNHKSKSSSSSSR